MCWGWWGSELMKLSLKGRVEPVSLPFLPQHPPCSGELCLGTKKKDDAHSSLPAAWFCVQGYSREWRCLLRMKGSGWDCPDGGILPGPVHWLQQLWLHLCFKVLWVTSVSIFPVSSRTWDKNCYSYSGQPLQFNEAAVLPSMKLFVPNALFFLL